MGLLSSIKIWVGGAISVAKTVVSAAAIFVSKAATVVDALLEGKSIIESKESSSADNRDCNIERPDIMGRSGSRNSEIAELQSTIDESRKKLISVKEDNELEHRRIQLQIDIMELIVSASTFERFTNNINLHASNLQIHLHTIQNTSGLLDDVNRQRVAIKALMGTVNHLINVTGSTEKVRKLEGLDIDIRPGSISIHSAYDAFENTRSLLLNEIDSFSKSIQSQMERIEDVRAAARKLPDASRKVSSWLNESVEPKLLDAKRSAEQLKGDLLVIPRLENDLRRNLEAIKEGNVEL